MITILGTILPAGAQSAGATSAGITGKITDAQGAAVAGAVIVARNVDTNFTREGLSDSDGAYLIRQLPPGTYELTISQEGFATQTSRITIVLGTTTLFNFTLQAGGGSEVVEVVASAELADKTESSTNIESRRIESLPINRRNFLDFALTSARVTPDRLPAQGVAATSGLSFNGQSARYNNITVDGLDNNDFVTDSVRSTFSQETVQEFQIISDSYSAEFGRALAGVINIVTKGGGNELHGSIFNFIRNDEISARNAFAPIDPEFKQYQFGATLGGPIKKDKAFFFTSFERLTLKQSNIVTIGNATIAAGNRLGFGLSNGAVPFAQSTSSLLARADIQLSPNDTLYLRYNYGGGFSGTFEPFGALVDQTAGGTQRLDDNNVAVSNTYVNPGLNLANETRFQFSRRTQLGLANGQGPRVSVVAPEGGVVFGRAVLLSQLRREDIYQFIDNVTLSRGRHQLKFGGDFTYIDFPEQNNLPVFIRGFAVFSPIDFRAMTGNQNAPVLSGLQSLDPTLRTPEQRAFLMQLARVLPMAFPGFPANQPLADLPIPLSFQQGFGDPTLAYNIKFFSAFVQDDIKLRPNLLVKAGLRYDIIRVRFQPKNNGNLSPRVAFSYRPHERVSVRGAYGLFFGAPVLGAVQITQTFVAGDFKIAVLPFPFSLLAFNQPGRRFPETPDVPASVRFIPQLSQTFQNQPDLRNSYTQQATLGFDIFLNSTNAVSLTYDLVRGLKLFGQRSINPVVRPVPGNPGLSAITGRIDTRRGDVFENQSVFDSYYHAFTVSYNRRFTNRLGILAHYTFAKSLDNTSDFRATVQEVNDPLNLIGERAFSLQDVRNRFVLSTTWELAYTKQPLLRGFQVSAIINAESGRPYNLRAGVDLNQNGDRGQGDRPLGIARNAGITPGFANVDVRLTRTLSLGERARLQAIAEVFNLFNRVNIDEVARVFPPDAQGRFRLPPTDGGRFIATPAQFRSAFAPRQCQLGFRLSF